MDTTTAAIAAVNWQMISADGKSVGIMYQVPEWEGLFLRLHGWEILTHLASYLTREARMRSAEERCVRWALGSLGQCDTGLLPERIWVEEELTRRSFSDRGRLSWKLLLAWPDKAEAEELWVDSFRTAAALVRNLESLVEVELRDIERLEPTSETIDRFRLDDQPAKELVQLHSLMIDSARAAVRRRELDSTKPFTVRFTLRLPESESGFQVQYDPKDRQNPWSARTLDGPRDHYPERW